MLWLALHFPLLLLEALPQRQSPSAVVARGRILVGDGAAAAAGVRAGQKLSTALGLQPGLAVLERDEPRERQALQALACWAGRFTPTLSLAPPDALLLEVGGCLRLFGGAQAIVGEVLAGCAAQGYSTGWAAAPAPLGARWLARHGAAAVYAEATAMQAALAALPCAVPGWPDEVGRRLESFGLIRLGDLLRLPAAGLRRRIGNGPLDDLLRARGELPDPQPLFVFPERFAIGIDLPSRVEHAEALVFAGQRLFAALAGWLHGRQLLLRRCSLQLTHDDGSPCVLALDFAEPSADEGASCACCASIFPGCNSRRRSKPCACRPTNWSNGPGAAGRCLPRRRPARGRWPAWSACVRGLAGRPCRPWGRRPISGRNAQRGNSMWPWRRPGSRRRTRHPGPGR